MKGFGRLLVVVMDSKSALSSVLSQDIVRFTVAEDCQNIQERYGQRAFF